MFVSLALAIAALQALAFDSETWLGKRAVMTREAERLRVDYTNYTARATRPWDDVTLPVEAFEDGSMKTVVFAKRAQYFVEDGKIWAEGVVVKRFDEKGNVEGRIEAASCVVDRASRSGWAEGAAKVVQGKTTFSGEGVYFSSPETYVKVFDKSKMTSEDLRFGAETRERTASVGKGACITSDTSDFDRAAGVAMFERNVEIDYADEYEMRSDRLFAFMAGTNELSRVVAIENVSITNGSRSGTCARAVYRRRKGEIEMFGDGQGQVARLVETGENAGEIEGARIRFWIGSEQVEVEQSRVSVKEGAEAKLL